jgi:hypothetical protein
MFSRVEAHDPELTGEGWDPGPPALAVAHRGVVQQDGCRRPPRVGEVVDLVAQRRSVDLQRRHRRILKTSS